MDEDGSTLSRQVIRRLKMMEHLASKRKLKMSNSTVSLSAARQAQKPLVTATSKGKENKIPVAVSCSKIRPIATIQPLGKVCQVSKTSAKNGITVCHPAAMTVQSRAGVCKDIMSTGKDTLASNYTQFKKPQNRGGKCVSTDPHPALITPSRNYSSAALIAPKSSVCGRISLGPLVKTRTGLFPVAILPRVAKSTSTCGSSLIINPTKQVHARTKIAQRPAAASRKTFPISVTHKPVHERIAAANAPIKRAGAQDQIKSTRPDISKLPRSVIARPKPKAASAKIPVPPAKKSIKDKTEKTVQSVVQPSHKPAQRQAKAEPATRGPTVRVASRTSALPVITPKATKVTQASAAKPGACDKTRAQTSSRVPHRQAPTKRTCIPVVAQTVTRPTRTIGKTGQTTNTKTPKATVTTEGVKPNAAQEERMRKLQEWREAKGISYKRPPMLEKPRAERPPALPQPYWTAMKEEEDAQSIIAAVDRSLADCIKLLGQGPTDPVREILSRLPAISKKFAKYWICKALLMEKDGNSDILPMFEEAVRVVLEPVDELRSVVFEILKRKDEAHEEENEKHGSPGTVDSSPEEGVDPLVTPKPVRALICAEKGESSVIKYKITATPGNPKSVRREPAGISGQGVRFLTPVRRSTRIDKTSQRYPASLQEHDLCVTSYDDLIAKEEQEREDEQGDASSPVRNTPMYVYRQNEALKDKVFVKLVCNDVNKTLDFD